jgi:hypothetical protein
MFKQGTRPALKAPGKKFEEIIARLLAAGYELHNGMRIKRKREAVTLRKRFTRKGEKRQNHVQIVLPPDEHEVSVFAHTEPDTENDFIMHCLDAFFDEVDYGAGARMLKRDLESIGSFLKDKFEKTMRKRA